MVDRALARQNRLLSRIPDNGLARLLDGAHVEDFAARTVVADRVAGAQSVLFPLSGMLSIVTPDPGVTAVEVATIGREGMAGVEALFGASRLPFAMMWQLPGSAIAVDLDVLRGQLPSQPELSMLAGRFLGALMAQIGQNAGCNRMHDLEQRAAKWLLLCRDRVDEDSFDLTHEFLAIMLGVTRPKLSQVQATFQRAGFIAYSRGRLTVLDRVSLEEQSCSCYRIIAGQFAAIDVPD